MFDNDENEEHWIPLADIMTTMMMIMLLIALFYITLSNQKQSDLQDIKQKYLEAQAVSNKYKVLKSDLYADLNREFKTDLVAWDAVIVEDTLSIKFLGSNAQFAVGSNKVSQEYRNILSNFFPRYLKILSSDKYKNSIAEIRIEGYASSLWQIAHSEQEVYLNNMKLSQGRAFSILQYLYQLPDARNFTKFLNDKLTANGMSYSHKVQTNNGVEDTMSSQRIEFKVNLNTDNQVINNLIMSKGS